MPKKKKKPKPPTATQLVKAAAREHIGAVPPTRRAPDPTKARKEKHKPTLGRLLAED